MASLLNMSGGSLLGKGLPYDYEVEYLGGNRDGYYIGSRINTNIDISSLDFIVETQGFGFWGYVREDVVNGTWIGRGNKIIYYNNFINRFSFDYNNGDSVTYNSKEGLFVNGNLLKSFVVSLGTNPLPNNIPLHLGCWYDCTRGRFEFPTEIYPTKIWVNSVLRMDAYPVCKDNVGYLYDKVTKQLFGNVGELDFIVGPRVS